MVKSEHRQLTRQERVKNLTDSITKSIEQLAHEVDEVKASEVFKAYLDCISKFHNYSINNQILILAQKPTASLVAGYRSWQNHNCFVMKGEKAIKILAPKMYKKKVVKEVLQIDGSLTTEEVEGARIYFIIVNVFDISQTDGEPLPSVEWFCEGEQGEEIYQCLLEYAKELHIEIFFFDGSKDGKQGLSAYKKIGLLEGKTPLGYASTLINEIAHEILHQRNENMTEEQKEKLQKKSREIIELEAEATTYVVLKHFILISLLPLITWLSEKLTKND